MVPFQFRREDIQMEPVTTLAALNAAFTLYEKAAKVLRDWSGKIPDKLTKEQATKDLAQAEEALAIAKVEIAKSFGFHLCRNHFSPGIMINLPEDPTLIDVQRKCETCGDVRPKQPAKRPKPEPSYF
jgi:hypothetical protein